MFLADVCGTRPVFAGILLTARVVVGWLPRGRPGLPPQIDGSTIPITASRAAMATVVVGGQTRWLPLTLLAAPVISAFSDHLRFLRAGKRPRIPDWFWERPRWVPSRLPDAPLSKGPAGPSAGRRNLFRRDRDEARPDHLQLHL